MSKKSLVRIGKPELQEMAKQLRTGQHICQNCILRERNKCPVYGKSFEVNGQEFRIGLDTECVILSSYQDDVIRTIGALPQVNPEDDVEGYAQILARKMITGKYIQETGLFILEDGRYIPNPLLALQKQDEESIRKWNESHGLSPYSRHRLSLDPGKSHKKSIGRMIREMHLEDKKENTGGTDAGD
jgi:hypothetical protein